MVNESNKLLNRRRCFQDLHTCCVRVKKAKPMFHIFESFICKAYMGLHESKIPWDNFCLPDKSPVMAVYVFFLYEYNTPFLERLMRNKRTFPVKSRRLLMRWYYRVKRFVNEKKGYILGSNYLNINKQDMNTSVLNKRTHAELTIANINAHNSKRMKKPVSRYADTLDKDAKLKDDTNCSDFDEAEKISDMSGSDRSEDEDSAGSLEDFVVGDDDEIEYVEEENDNKNITNMPEEVETSESEFDSDQDGWD
tara:strand:+ start:815 stop:1567 length:753 start_codon:yes stop_codon:yes gene_type:complete